MRVSEYFGLGRTQPTLDFVDVDIVGDVPAFIDPKAIRVLGTDWCRSCQALLQSFFSDVLLAISRGDFHRVESLLTPLSEPNETHLGLSIDKARGRGLGGSGAEQIAESLAKSSAAKSGLLADLEDSALLVAGIGKDIISDITTNVIRRALVEYTRQACAFYGIPMEHQYLGSLWDPDQLEWSLDYGDLPRANDDRLLLVPKAIVRFTATFDKNKYYRGYVAPYLKAQEIAANSELVTLLKNGSSTVLNKDLDKKYPTDKQALVGYTQQFSDALPSYRRSFTIETVPIPDHEDFAGHINVPTPDYDQLLDVIRSIGSGPAAAKHYHLAVEKLLTAAFFPYLDNPQLEKEIHEGRKRLDIVYDDVASSGTFYWLSKNYHTPIIPVEIKNYSRDIANPELDQIAGRFSDHRGWLGIIVCRRLEDKSLFLDRCRDTARDGRGYILALDDDDLATLVAERKDVAYETSHKKAQFGLIRERFDYLVG